MTWLHLGCLSFVVAAVAPMALAAEGNTYEALLKRAAPLPDLAAVVALSVDDCAKARRDIDRARCRAVKAFMGTTLPDKIYVVPVDDPKVISVSEYDGRVRGFSLRVAGCLACDGGVETGAGKRMVTLKVPGKSGPLYDAVEVASSSVAFADIAASKVWAQSKKGKLRAEFVFSPESTPWTAHETRGVAFKLLGTRVYDRCTGEVIFSSPPSQKTGSRATTDGEGDCVESAGTAANGEPDVPAALSTSDINLAMGAIRDRFDACDAHFRMKGTAHLDLVVAPTGHVQAATLAGPLDGTAVARCLVEAAGQARFTPFGGQARKFRYPVILTGDQPRR